jgi:hypothetical protein
MKKLLFLLLFTSNSVFAENECKVKPKKKESHKSVVIVKPIATPLPTVKEPCCGASETIVNKATTGNQTVTVAIPNPKPIVIRRTYWRYKDREHRVEVYKPNRLQLMLGASKTKLDIEGDCCNLTARRLYEPDVGLQYLRDFGSFTGSLMGTSNKGLYLGVGVNW